jgi:hypothetical protein
MVVTEKWKGESAGAYKEKKTENTIECIAVA